MGPEAMRKARSESISAHDHSPRGHDLTLLRELQELTPAERLERNWRMAELVEELRAAGEKAHATERSLPSPC
jgi:hypothetical protein